MRKSNRRILSVVLTTAMVLSTGITAIAGTWRTGADSNQSRWWYDNEDGSYAVNGWHWIDGNQDGIAECYYFDNNGWMYVSGETPDGYTVNENGAWVANGVVEVKSVSSSIASTESTESTDSRIGAYHPVKHIDVGGNTYATAEGLADWGMVGINIIEATDDSVTILSFGADKAYVYTRSGDFYKNDGDPGDGDWTVYLRFESDGTLVIFDDVYGESYYQK